MHDDPMTRIHSFVSQLSGRAQVCHRIKLLFRFLTLSIVVCVCIAIMNQFKGIYLNPLVYYPAVILLSLLCGFVISLFYRPDKLTLLINIEKKLDLKERLSTAYEFRDKTSHPFYKELIRNAAESAANIIPRKLQPLPFSATLGILLPLIGLVIVFSIIRLDIDISSMWKKPIETAGTGILLEKYSTLFDKEIHPLASPEISGFIDDLEILGLEMQMKEFSKEELEILLQDLGIGVKENLEPLLSELENKEYSPSDLGLIRLLAYFASHTFIAEELQSTLDSLEASYKEKKIPEIKTTGDEADIKLNKQEGSTGSKKGEIKDLEFYPDYMNTLHSLQEQLEHDNKTIVVPENERVIRGDSDRKEAINSNGDPSRAKLHDRPDEQSAVEDHTSQPDSGNGVENSEGEAGESGTASSSLREESSTRGPDQESGIDTIVIQGTGSEGQILELINELSGDELLQGDDVSGVYKTKFRQEMEQAVSEGKIPEEYARYVRNYFLYINRLLAKEKE